MRGSNFIKMAVVGALLCCTGCASVMPSSRGTVEQPLTSTSAAEVGSVHVDVVGLSRWDDVKDNFNPAYALTGDAAVTAVRATQSFEATSIQRAFSASGGIEVSGPSVSRTGSGQTSTSTTSGPTGATTTTTDTQNTTTNESPAPSPSVSTSAGLTPQSSGAALTGTPTLAPSMAYSAGNSLFQYVTALKNGVDGLTDQCGYDAYLVMVRVAIIPLKRRQPYDTFIDLSLVPSALTVSAPTTATNARRGSQISLESTRLVVGSSSVAGATRQDAADCGEKPSPNTVVIHTLSADSLENAQEDWTSQALRTAALGLAAKWGPAGISANFAKMSTAIDQYLSLRPNSLLTIGSLSPNAVRIRLGANRIGNTDFETLPMTHDITLLVLVPSGRQYLPYTALGHVFFTDARSGAAFEHDMSYDNLVERQKYTGHVAATVAMEIQGTFPTNGPGSYDTDPAWKTLSACAQDYSSCGPINGLVTFISNGDFDGFAAATTKIGINAVYNGELWQYLSKLASHPGLATAIFRLPSSHLKCPVDQTPVLADDGETTSVTIVGGRGFKGRPINARLASTDPTKPLALVAASDGSSESLSSFSFPSLRKVGWSGGTAKLTFSIEDARDPGRVLCPGPNAGDYRLVGLSVTPKASKPKTKARKPETPEAKGPITVTMGSTQIAQTTGKGTISFGIVIDPTKADSVKIESHPAELVTIGPVAPGPDQTITITTAGNYLVTLDNLIPAKTEHLVFTALKGGKPVGMPLDESLSVH